MKEEACKNRFEELNARKFAIEKKENEMDQRRNAMDEKENSMKELEIRLNFWKDELEARDAALEEREEKKNEHRTIARTWVTLTNLSGNGNM